MTDSRHRILTMLAEGKIKVEEAERLLTAVEQGAEETTTETKPETKKKQPKYLYVEVNADEGGKSGKDRVNIKIPLRLIKTGMALGSLLPEQAKDKVNTALGEKGIDLDLNNLNRESLDELIEELRDIEITAEDKVDKVRIYCA